MERFIIQVKYFNQNLAFNTIFKSKFNRAVSEKVAEHGKERMLADSPRERISAKEKLAEMREKAFRQQLSEKLIVKKQGEGGRFEVIREG